MSSYRKEHSFRFSGWNYTFITDNGVFSKEKVDAGTEIFLNVLTAENLSGSVVDMGCGYGVISIVLKHIFPSLEVTAVDVNPRAVELAALNAKTNSSVIHAMQSDGFEKVEGLFDHVVTNPPIRAGKQVIYGMFADAHEHLRNKGSLYVVIRRQQGAESAVKELESIYGNCTILEKKKGYWVLRSLKLTD